ncbi:threonine dehydratase [Pseudonocardia sediminis]|uniref:Threonine dehydratase n=1 Tax=Pseudonocardia sediminis TaxID=1397368 RepID=A0A4Q7UWD2_PSEST|nr:threonine/serine dehydratase [Pseudonocardia sediminis]RZT84473.1 threonine dehydratase [Pseudonocardia sediminis]
MAELIGLDDITTAAERIAGQVVRTPTVHSPGLSALLGAPVTAKLELLQRSGSFKPRGVLAKIATLSPAERDAGLVAVSGGNHGIALADVAGSLGIAATVVMPESAPARSVQIARDAGADVRLTPDMAGAFALTAELQAAGVTLVHPFDDPVVLAGQATVGLEMVRDLPAPVTDVLVSIGGGALISGVAAAVRALVPGVRVWGVETVGAEAMSTALRVGGPTPVSLSSIVSTLSAPSVSQLTYDHVRELVHDVLVVSDAEAVQGAVDLAEHGKVWGEPAAGCLLPAARRVLAQVDDARLGLVVCGGNTTVADLADRIAHP